MLGAPNPYLSIYLSWPAAALSPTLHDSALLVPPTPIYSSVYLGLQLLDPFLQPALVHAQLLLQGAFLGWVRDRVLGLELG